MLWMSVKEMKHIRNVKLIENFRNKDMKKFWCEVAYTKKTQFANTTKY